MRESVQQSRIQDVKVVTTESTVISVPKEGFKVNGRRNAKSKYMAKKIKQYKHQ